MVLRARARTFATALSRPSVAKPRRGSIVTSAAATAAVAAAPAAPKAALSVLHVVGKLLEGDAGKTLPLWQVGLATFAQVALTFLVSRTIVQVVRAAAAHADTNLEQHIDQMGRVSLQYAAINSALFALQGPVSFFLPLAAVLFAMHKGADFIEDVLFVQRDTFNSLATGTAEKFAAVLNGVDHLSESLSGVFLVALVTWCIISWKDKIVDVITYRGKDEASAGRLTEFDKMLRPISQASTWLLVAGGMLSTLNILGIDISPLVTVGGVSGIAIGFGAQSVTASIISGLNLFLTRPFVVGERVKVTNQFGATIVEGVVESINPMRTILTNKQNHSVAMPNKALIEMNIINQSRLEAAKAAPVTMLAPLYSSVGIKYKDISAVPAVAHAISQYLRNSEVIDTDLPNGCHLQSLKEADAAEYKITAHTLARNPAHQEEVQMDLMLHISKIVQNQGAELAYVETLPGM